MGLAPHPELPLVASNSLTETELVTPSQPVTLALHMWKIHLRAQCRLQKHKGQPRESVVVIQETITRQHHIPCQTRFFVFSIFYCHSTLVGISVHVKMLITLLAETARKNDIQRKGEKTEGSTYT